MEEIFVDIIGYEGIYMISNYGRVKNKKEKLLALENEKHGYVRVHLWKNGKSKHYLVHRLVAEAFIPNHDNLPQVNHIDENKSNNHVDNLEWCTMKYNNEYGTRVKRLTSTQRNDIIKSKIINQYDLYGNFIRTWPSLKEIERELGFNTGNVGKCCKGGYYIKGKLINIRQSYGYIWKYAD